MLLDAYISMLLSRFLLCAAPPLSLDHLVIHPVSFPPMFHVIIKPQCNLLIDKRSPGVCSVHQGWNGECCKAEAECKELLHICEDFFQEWHIMHRVSNYPYGQSIIRSCMSQQGSVTWEP